MAWVTVTYACGHTGEVQLYGKASDREWRKSKIEQEFCPECAQKRLDEQNRKAAEYMKELGAVELIGTPKQILWAEGIRKYNYDALIKESADLRENRKNNLEYCLKKGKTDRIDMYKAELDAMEIAVELLKEEILSERSASKIIDERDHSVRTKLDVLTDKVAANPEAYKIKAEETIQLLKPEKPTKTGYCTVNLYIDRYDISHINAVYPKDDDFRAICKKHGFTWNTTVWTRKPSGNSHSLVDSAADLVNDLLVNGFTVEVKDPYVAEAVKTGQFQPDEKEYIVDLYQEDGKERKYAVRWVREEVKDYFLHLPGAYLDRYDRVIIKERNFREIREGADLFGLYISNETQKLLDKKYEETVVSVSPKESAISDKSIKDILDSSREVLDDLKD